MRSIVAGVLALALTGAAHAQTLPLRFRRTSPAMRSRPTAPRPSICQCRRSSATVGMAPRSHGDASMAGLTPAWRAPTPSRVARASEAGSPCPRWSMPAAKATICRLRAAPMDSFGTGNAAEASPSSLGPLRFGAESRRNSTVKGTRKKSGRCSHRIAARRFALARGRLRPRPFVCSFECGSGVDIVNAKGHR
jgi:hypothetical protein